MGIGFTILLFYVLSKRALFHNKMCQYFIPWHVVLVLGLKRHALYTFHPSKGARPRDKKKLLALIYVGV